MALTATEEAETRQLLAQLTELLSLADNQPAIISELGADDITIPELDAVTSILTTDEFLLNQGGTVKRATGTNLFDFTQTYVRLTTYIATKNYVIGDRVIASDNNIYKCLIANGPTTTVVNPIADTTSTWVIEINNHFYSQYIDYSVNQRVIGSDGNVYKCLIANGPATSVINPVGDTTGTWGNNWAVFHIQDQKTIGTNGGSVTAGVRTVRDLNTIIKNTIAGASLSSNQFTLPPGKYKISCSSPAYRVYGFVIFLYNVTDTIYEPMQGTSGYVAAADLSQARSFLTGEINVVSSSKTYEIHMETADSESGYGLGVAAAVATEVYTTVEIERNDG